MPWLNSRAQRCPASGDRYGFFRLGGCRSPQKAMTSAVRPQFLRRRPVRLLVQLLFCLARDMLVLIVFEMP
eukprot:15444242-Alexandrium_andersonii.AAC.1